MLHVFLRVVERHLQQTHSGAASGARFGVVSFVHRFGGSLNRHVHFRCCVVDGVFEGGPDGQLQFRPAQPLIPEALAAAASASQPLPRVLAPHAPRRGAKRRLIAFVTASEPVMRILTHLGVPAEPPRIAPDRGPPAWDDLLAPRPDWDTLAQPAPEFTFHQRIAW